MIPKYLKPLTDAGDGVFLSCVEPGTKVCKGTLLGIVPGIIQSSYELPPQEDPRVEKSYLTCYDDTSIKFDAFLPYPLNFGYSNFDPKYSVL